MKILMKPVTAAHIFVNSREDKNKYSKDVWDFMDRAYQGNFLSFTDEFDMKDDSLLWLIVSSSDIITDFESQVHAIAIFKQKFGLKLVAIAKNVSIKRSTDAVTSIIRKYITSKAWIEVSGGAERLVSSVLSTDYIIPASQVQQRLSIIDIMDDGNHYLRKLGNGAEVVKIAYGIMK